MFEHFWECKENLTGGYGFDFFTTGHFIELGIAVAFTVIMTIIYHKKDEVGRKKIRKWFVIGLLADEAFKHTILLITDAWDPTYLPLHLCSINIFLITYHYFTNNKVVGNFLWAFCLPGAIAALLFSTWHNLPYTSFMHIHSYTVHVLLAAYPVVVTLNKDVIRDYRLIPKLFLILLIICIPAFIANKVFDGCNFMFLEKAAEGSPLVFFQNKFGSHLYGFLVLVPLVIGIMYIPYKKVAQ